MKYLVTGSAGFIGAQLAKELVNRGHEVFGIDNFVTGYRDRVFPEYTFIEGDLRDESVYEKLPKDLDGIFHLAAVPRVPRSIEEPKMTHDYNTNSVINLFEFARLTGVKKIVSASSSTVYGNQERMPLHEGMVLQPISPYGAQKALLEHYARTYAFLFGIDMVCLRLFSVYGPGMNLDEQHALAIPAFIKARRENRPLTIFGDGTYTRDCTHVSDVVNAFVLSMEHADLKKFEVFNIGAGKNVSINHLAQVIGGEVQYKEGRKEVKDTHADNAKARSVLQWEPKVTIEEGIADLKKIYGIS